MNESQKVKLIIGCLKKLYPDTVCALVYNEPHELMIAARLSAQCTDKRVNLITPALFKRYADINDFAEANIGELEGLIRSCGLYKTKARDIKEMCKMLRDEYDGSIPDRIDELIKLPGIGRKTANLLVGTLYGKPAVVTDTHVIRLSNRIGLVNSKEPIKVENALRKLLPENESLDFCHRLVFFGRDACRARNPNCLADRECVIKKYCNYYKNSVY
ncbi:MAG: endonuclease III [Oscillospiraceae bacterium]|nr:endonuclease III [Oscillospiraceae bacterium]